MEYRAMVKPRDKEIHDQTRFPGVFVVGCPRSGTSIVQRSLANHPHATSLPETGYFRQLGSNRLWTRFAEAGLVRRACSTRAMERLERITGHVGASNTGNDRATWLTRRAANFFASHLDSITASRGAGFWIEKTPKHYQTAEVIRRYLQQCIVVHVVRDGRDVLGSIRDRAMKYPERFARELPPERGVHEWNKALRAAWRHSHQDRVFIVRYEAFIKNPQGILTRLMQAIGEVYDEDMLRSESRNAISIDVEEWKQGLDDPITQQESKYEQLFEDGEKAWISRNLDYALLERIDEIALQTTLPKPGHPLP